MTLVYTFWNIAVNNASECIESIEQATERIFKFVVPQ